MDNASVPEWLTEDYFRTVLQRKSTGDVTIQNITTTFAEVERTHGKLVRSVVELSTPSGTDTRSFFIKCARPGEFATTAASANLFRMESLVMGKVIPAMEQALESAAPGRFQPLAPRLVDSSLEGNRFIMTEDWTVHGFKPGRRQVGLDLESSMAYVKHLAVFHASSVAVLEKLEPEIKAIPLLVDSKESKHLKSFIENSVKAVASELETWEDASQYTKEVRDLAETLPERLFQANRSRSAKLNVLCHGDAYVNNILFRREGKNVTGVCLVDFELSRVGSFADDLAGFVYSAPDDGVLREHADALVEAYREALNETLHLLGLGEKAVTEEDVRREMHEQRAVAVFAALHMLPHSRADRAVDQSATGAAAACRESALRTPLRILLERLRTRGWLDQSETRFQHTMPASMSKDCVETYTRLFCVAGLVSLCSFIINEEVNNTTASFTVPSNKNFVQIEKSVPRMKPALQKEFSGKFKPITPSLAETEEEITSCIVNKDTAVQGFQGISKTEGQYAEYFLILMHILVLYQATFSNVPEQKSYGILEEYKQKVRKEDCFQKDPKTGVTFSEYLTQVTNRHPHSLQVIYPYPDVVKCM